MLAVKKWARMNAPPPSSADLRATASSKIKTIDDLKEERSDIVALLPDLVLSPAKADEAEARLLEIEATLPIKVRALEMIEADIPQAEERELVAAFEAKRIERERASVKLSRNLKARYEAAAEAFIAVLTDMENDERAWTQLDLEAQAAGLARVSGESAELRLRKGLSPASRGGFQPASLWRAARVEGWNHHRLLYSGDVPNGGAGHIW